MCSERSVALVLAVGALASIASAQGYGDRGEADAIRDTSEATLDIAGFAGGAWRTLNSDGRVAVPVSEFFAPEFHAIGKIDVESGAQTDIVEAAWWELTLPNEHLVQFIYKTQGGMQFVPFGAKESGNAIMAYTYEMGRDGNGIDFRSWVDDVFLHELKISYSSDGGQTVFSDPTLYDPVGSDAWSGSDAEHLGLAFPGDGVNWIQATYTIEIVPAPASATALLAPGLLLLRRRR
jgi:hypothetical protein